MLGIGQVGLPIAINLMRAGYRVIGIRRPDQEPFERNGGETVASPAELTRLADIVLLCLPSEEAQHAMLDGPDGVMEALTPGKVVIDLGTYRKDFKLEQARRITARGAEMLEAEISGSPPLITQRKAALYVGGDEALFERCKPVLEAMTGHHFHLGELGSGFAMKMIANYLLTIHTLAAAEAMNLGVHAGFNPHRLVEVISSGAGNSTMFTVRAPMMAARAFSPAPGPFKTLEKYVRMAAEMAKDLGCASPLFATAAPYFLRAIEMGMSEEDIAAVIKLIESESTPVAASKPQS
jgi:3-hydroxyisobutyrate dehydrogenase